MAKPTTPLLAVDIIIELDDRPGSPIVLIERRKPPYGWALPGGFVDVGETLEQAARREALEETALDVRLQALLGCYSDPRRDARGHTVSAVYVARAGGVAEARDDALNLGIFAPGAPPEPLVFDHALILREYLYFRATGRTPPLPGGAM